MKLDFNTKELLFLNECRQTQKGNLAALRAGYDVKESIIFNWYKSGIDIPHGYTEKIWQKQSKHPRGSDVYYVYEEIQRTFFGYDQDGFPTWHWVMRTGLEIEIEYATFVLPRFRTKSEQEERMKDSQKRYISSYDRVDRDIQAQDIRDFWKIPTVGSWTVLKGLEKVRYGDHLNMKEGFVERYFKIGFEYSMDAEAFVHANPLNWHIAF